MFTKLKESSGGTIGFRVSGIIRKEDYELLESEVNKLLEKHESFNLMLYFDKFLWEFMEAWGKDAGFGVNYGSKIGRIAIVGDKKWQKVMAKLSAPIFGKESKYFYSDNINAAWDWLSKK